MCLMANFDTLHSPILITRKIWVTEIFCSLHTVLTWHFLRVFDGEISISSSWYWLCGFSGLWLILALFHNFKMYYHKFSQSRLYLHFWRLFVPILGFWSIFDASLIQNNKRTIFKIFPENIENISNLNKNFFKDFEHKEKIKIRENYLLSSGNTLKKKPLISWQKVGTAEKGERECVASRSNAGEN